MKLIILSTCMFSCLFMSCSKTVTNISKENLSGTWKLIKISGGYAGIDSTPTDNITIAFETGGKYSSTFNSAITASGNYTLSKAGEPNYYYSKTLLNLFPIGSSEKIYGVNLTHDSLSILEGCCDQFGYTYIRQK